MGLPIAAYFATHGAHVTGIDLHPSVVEHVNAGKSTVSGEAGLGEAVERAVAAGTLVATSSYDAVEAADVVVVLIPLLAHAGQPDFSVLDDGVARLAKHLRGETLVVFETTLPVGTTRDRFGAALRAAEPRTLVAFSPERVFSGRVFADLETYPKLVGGIDSASTERAVEFYESVLSAEVWALSSSEEAEMVKLAETTYRDLNIAYANELARICDQLGLDVVEVINGANSQPFSHIHQPGVGVGGHCIPHYPHLLLDAGVPSDLISLGRSINEGMPAWTVERLTTEVGDLAGKRILGLGVSYRPGVRESESSPVFGVRNAVAAAGGFFVAADPLYDDAALEELGLVPWEPGQRIDAVVLITPHEDFDESMLDELAATHVLDGRNAWDRDKVEAAGATYIGFGR